MVKIFLTIISLFILLMSTEKSSASIYEKYPSIEEVRQNYHTCQKVDESWYRRWGRYVIAFDIYNAVEKCNKSGYHMTRPTGCFHEKNWLIAGFYCMSNL